MTIVSTFFFFQAEDGIRDYKVTGVQTCALPIYSSWEERFMDGSLQGSTGCPPGRGRGTRRDTRRGTRRFWGRCAGTEEIADAGQVAQGARQVLAHGEGGFFVALAPQQFQDVQMLLAVLAVARPVLHGAVGQQAPHAVDAADGVDEEHVARGLDQGLVEGHPPGDRKSVV